MIFHIYVSFPEGKNLVCPIDSDLRRPNCLTFSGTTATSALPTHQRFHSKREKRFENSSNQVIWVI